MFIIVLYTLYKITYLYSINNKKKFNLLKLLITIKCNMQILFANVSVLGVDKYLQLFTWKALSESL